MRRRIADYDPTLGFGSWQTVATIGGFVVGLSMLIFIINMVQSARAGVPAPANPWRSRSIEWQIPSPPPEENYFSHRSSWAIRTTTACLVRCMFASALPGRVKRRELCRRLKRPLWVQRILPQPTSEEG